MLRPLTSSPEGQNSLSDIAWMRAETVRLIGSRRNVIVFVSAGIKARILASKCPITSRFLSKEYRSSTDTPSHPWNGNISSSENWSFRKARSDMPAVFGMCKKNSLELNSCISIRIPQIYFTAIILGYNPLIFDIKSCLYFIFTKDVNFLKADQTDE